MQRWRSRACAGALAFALSGCGAAADDEPEPLAGGDTSSGGAEGREPEAKTPVPGSPAPGGAPAEAPSPTAPLADAISLARVATPSGVRLVAVTKDEGAALEVVDVGAALGDAPRYPLDLVTKHGFAKVAAVIAGGARMTVARSALLPPVAEGTSHVASAENYTTHQEETGAAPTPFLFPKVVAPTSADVEVARQKGDLLDYEVELCVAFGKDIASKADLAGAVVGYVLCDDLSERATQILGMDPNDMASGKGFPDAKSRAGFLPLGPYVVVPKDPSSFLSKVTLRLRVNGALRQDDAPRNMLWDLSRIVDEALAIGASPRFSLGGKPLALLPSGRIEKGTLVVTGTPGGVTLKAPSLAFKASKAALYYATGQFLGPKTVEAFVAEAYVEELRERGGFLQPGDVVDAEGAMLGAQRIRIQGTKE